MGVKDYDLNPDNNTQINGINIAEGCPPSGINNAVRQLMADVKADSDAQDIAIEALKTKAETPASAENLGPVKVGDGLSMGEDGTLSADLATAEKPGRVKASETAKAGAVPVANEDGKLDMSWLGLFNSRIIIIESTESWQPPVTGWARVTVIGGGGGGGAGGIGYDWRAGKGGKVGGTTTFGTITANPGCGGGGGGAGDNQNFSGAGGGGGGAGQVLVEYVYFSGVTFKVIIGAGGAGGTGDNGENPFGTDGSGTYGGKGGKQFVGGAGGKNSPSIGSGTRGVGGAYGSLNGCGGSGGMTGFGYGGGGGGGGGYSTDFPEYGKDSYGAGMDGGKDGETGNGVAPASGGAGGSGAVIIEYYDPEKEGA